MRWMLAAFIVLGWLSLTSAAVALVPARSGDTRPDLAFDPHWRNRTPPYPVTVDKAAPLPALPVTTTTATTQVARRYTTPGPTVPRVRVVVAPGSGVERWRSLVASYGDWDVNLMLRIMDCESGGNPLDQNRSSGAAGLLQIYPAQSGSFDPATNIAQGHAKWLASGYAPWNPSRGCWG